LQRLIRNQLQPRFATAAELADVLKISAPSLSRLMSEGQGSLETIEKVARHMGYSNVGDFFAAQGFTLGDAEGFAEAFKESREAYGATFTEEVWALVPTVRWAKPIARANVPLVVKAAETLALEISLRESITIPAAPKVHRDKKAKALPPGRRGSGQSGNTGGSNND
jgi:transcriptional regulator with XRE-family HTH domain